MSAGPITPPVSTLPTGRAPRAREDAIRAVAAKLEAHFRAHGDLDALIDIYQSSGLSLEERKAARAMARLPRPSATQCDERDHKDAQTLTDQEERDVNAWDAAHAAKKGSI